ncbi:hypothetical protein KILIM_087_00080 [Kineosphaera limosa NBRC 100340]|uniref:Uncharacterized protein n=1 Tax=Kineosphaera limosa NBRC 100340 TaxID=1184609 RepID=K6VNX2_9MICO|nr:hypothetical protein KILIM_087_00080 [Kineosphaera limosa NBRC 100340]
MDHCVPPNRLGGGFNEAVMVARARRPCQAGESNVSAISTAATSRRLSSRTTATLTYRPSLRLSSRTNEVAGHARGSLQFVPRSLQQTVAPYAGKRDREN